MNKVSPAETLAEPVDELSAVEPDDELLVAYLDGELQREERLQVEQRLLDDEGFRKRLQSFQRTWDFLEHLPTIPTDEKSVQTTLELVVADLTANRTATPRRQKHPRAWSPLRYLLALILTVGLVFAGLRFLQSWQTARQVADFPVAMDIDAYAFTDNLALLEDLRLAPQWRSVVQQNPVPDLESLIDPSAPDTLFPSNSPGGDMAALTNRLEALPDKQRTIASARWNRFEQLDREPKTQLRLKAERVRTDDRSIEILQTARDYARWREQLSDETVRRIESQSGDQRMSAINDAIEETVLSIGRTTRRSLSKETIERIDYAMIEIIKNRIDAEGEAAERMLRFMKQRTRDIDDPDAAYRACAFATFRGDDRDRHHGPRPVGDQRDGKKKTGSNSPSLLKPLSYKELETIENMLTASDIETLQRYEADPWMRSMIIREWIEEALRRKLLGKLQPDSLLDQYRQMPPVQREWIDLSNPEEARKQLLEAKVNE